MGGGDKKWKRFASFLSNQKAQPSTGLSTTFRPKIGRMLINSKSSEKLAKAIAAGNDVYCGGLFLSARWFVISQVAKKGLHLIVMPTQEAAEYCSADLYNLVEGDCIFFLPSSGKGIERSNYKSSLCVQRTAALGKIADNKGELSFIVTWPDAMEEKIPDNKTIKSSIWTLKKGDEIPFDEILTRLYDNGFEKVDFQPGLAGNKMPETIRVVLLELGKRKVFQAQSSVSATFCLLPPRAEEEVSFCPAG